MQKKKLIKATAAAFSAQGVTALVSALTVFLLADSLDAAEYGLWQLFLLIGSYAGLFHLGICDGVYLRLGGRNYCELDHARLGTTFRRMIGLQVLAATLGTIALAAFFSVGGRTAAMIAALLYMPTFNAAAYLGYIRQATGHTVIYSISSMIDRVGFVLLAWVCALTGQHSFVYYAIASILAKFISLVYLVVYTREIVFSPSVKNDRSIVRQDIRSGSELMISNLAGQFVGGAARFAVISRFGDAEFGRVSFIMTLSGVFLQLASQLSMVLFPSMRREKDSEFLRLAGKMRSAAGFLLPATFLGYLPVKIFVEHFLPRWSSGLIYLPLLLPLCLFDGKTQLVSTTFLKVRRHERLLFAVNLSAAGLSLVLCFGAARLFESLGAVLAGAVLASAVRYVVADALCRREEERNAPILDRALFLELSLCMIFSVSAAALPDTLGVIVYSAVYLVYVYLRQEEFITLFPGRQRIKKTSRGES